MQGDEKMTKWDKQRADKDSPDWGISMYSPNGRMTTLLRLLLLWLFSVLLTPPPPSVPPLEKCLNEIKRSVVKNTD